MRNVIQYGKQIKSSKGFLGWCIGMITNSLRSNYYQWESEVRKYDTNRLFT